MAKRNIRISILIWSSLKYFSKWFNSCIKDEAELFDSEERVAEKRLDQSHQRNQIHQIWGRTQFSDSRWENLQWDRFLELICMCGKEMEEKADWCQCAILKCLPFRSCCADVFWYDTTKRWSGLTEYWSYFAILFKHVQCEELFPALGNIEETMYRTIH